MRLSVLDVGSNTVHLLLLDVYPGSRPEPYASHKMALRLVDYQDDDGRITDEGRDLLTGFVVEARDFATATPCWTTSSPRPGSRSRNCPGTRRRP